MTQPSLTRRVQCMQCLAETVIPDGADPHAFTWCGCCTRTDPATGQIHHHGRAAEACAGSNGTGHPGAACPHPNPKVCVRVSVPADVTPGDIPVDGREVPAMPGRRGAGEPCPGGHCGIGVDGCTVCRPVIHFATAGDVRMGL